MERRIVFDMDGTLADLYSVEEWKEKLNALNPTPYKEAKPLFKFSQLARQLNTLQENGYEICVISWLSMTTNETYDNQVRKAKMRWLQTHLPSVVWNEIHIVEYGVPKSSIASGILFDDNADVRKDWCDNGGIAFDERSICQVLGLILSGEFDLP